MEAGQQKKVGSGKTKRVFFNYDEDKVSRAIEDIKNGMSTKRASEIYGVPRTTLARKLLKADLKRKMGPSTILTLEEEQVLEDWLIAMARRGFPVHRSNLLQTVQKIVKENNRDNCFRDGMPGRTWFIAFLRRHPRLKQKYAETVSKGRAVVTRDRIEGWFDEIYQYLAEENLLNVLEDSTRIFNGDETGFALCPKSGIVIGPAGNREDFYERTCAEKQQITVMATFSADGKVVPPMVIFPYKKMPQEIVEQFPDKWALGRSDSGWMNSEVFYEYIGNHFLPYLRENDISRPVLLFVDGHRSHLTKHVSQLCSDNGIILISLFPNATHILQPADVAIFKPLKTGWTSAVRKWKFDNFPKDVTKHTFSSILACVFDQYAKEETIKNGFRKCGLYPFNKNSVDYSKCLLNRNIQNSLKSSNTSLVQSQIILAKVEEIIDNNELIKFKQTFNRNEEWTGNLEFKALYALWKVLKEKTIPEHIVAENSSPFTSRRVSQEDQSDELNSLQDPIESSCEPNLLRDISENNILDQETPTTSSNSQNVWGSPIGKHYGDKQVEGYKVPTPFKKILVFPKTPEKQPVTPIRKRKIFPAVVSSSKYKELYNQAKGKSGGKVTKRRKPETNILEEEMKENILQKKNKNSKKDEQEETSSESEQSVVLDDEDLDLSDTGLLLELSKGDFVIVKYNDDYFPGKT